VNEKIRIAESAHKVIEVQNLLGQSYQGNLVVPTRKFIYQGDLYKISRHAVQKRFFLSSSSSSFPWHSFTGTILLYQRMFFLFNDLIVYAKTTSSRLTEGSCQYKGEILMTGTWVRDLPDTKILQNGKIQFCIAISVFNVESTHFFSFLLLLLLLLKPFRLCLMIKPTLFTPLMKKLTIFFSDF